MKKIRFSPVKTYWYCKLSFRTKEELKEAVIILSQIKPEELNSGRDVSSQFLKDFSKYYLENLGGHFIRKDERSLSLGFTIVRDCGRLECICCKSIALVTEITDIIMKAISGVIWVSLKVDHSNLRNWVKQFLGYQDTDFDFYHNEFSNYLVMAIDDSGKYYFELRTSNFHSPH